MTQPRRLPSRLPHATTRRVRGRRFFLKPTAWVADLTRYCVALAAGRHREGISLYAYTAQANHTHANLKDLHAEGELSVLPFFKRDLHRNLACALNDHYGEAEGVWGPGSYSNTEIHSPLSVDRQLVYLWTQPVRDGLCERLEDWPGFMLLPEDFGKIIFARRPPGAYFGTTRRRDPSVPPQPTERTPQIASFRVGVPPGYEGLPLDLVRAYFRFLLDAALDDLRAERERRDLGYRGIPAVLAQSHLDSPGPVVNDGSLNPRIACAGDVAHLRWVLAGFRAWRDVYRFAYEDLLAGQDAVFPPGTWGRHCYPRALPLPCGPPPD